MINKYKKWSVNRLRNLQIGLLFSMGLVFMAFEWTSVPPTYSDENIMDGPGEVLHVIRKAYVTPKKAVPPPARFTKVVEIDDSNTPEFTEDPKPVENPLLSEVKMTNAPVGNIALIKVPRKPAIIPEEPNMPEEEPIQIIVERMPMFNAFCSELNNETDRRSCSNKAMLEFIYKHVKYPQIARENNIEGTVVAQFIIDTDGQVVDINIVKDIGGGCGHEVMRLIHKMPQWIPGRQRSKKVKVRYSLPVKFRLDKG